MRFRRQVKAITGWQIVLETRVQLVAKFFGVIPRHRFHRVLVAFIEPRGVFAHDCLPLPLRDLVFANPEITGQGHRMIAFVGDLKRLFFFRRAAHHELPRFDGHHFQFHAVGKRQGLQLCLRRALLGLRLAFLFFVPCHLRLQWRVAGRGGDVLGGKNSVGGLSLFFDIPDRGHVDDAIVGDEARYVVIVAGVGVGLPQGVHEDVFHRHLARHQVDRRIGLARVQLVGVEGDSRALIDGFQHLFP